MFASTVSSAGSRAIICRDKYSIPRDVMLLRRFFFFFFFFFCISSHTAASESVQVNTTVLPIAGGPIPSVEQVPITHPNHPGSGSRTGMECVQCGWRMPCTGQALLDFLFHPAASDPPPLLSEGASGLQNILIPDF